MFYRNAAFILMAMLLASHAWAAKISLRLGYLLHPHEQTNDLRPRAYTSVFLETSQQSFTSFELSMTGYWSDLKKFQGSNSKLIYQGMGLHHSKGGIAANLGLQLPIEKYRIEGLRFSLSKYIGGVYAYLNWENGFVKADYREFHTAMKSKQQIDSYEIEFKPAPYNVLQIQLTQQLGSLDLNLNIGRYSQLSAVYNLIHIVSPIAHDPVYFFKTGIAYQASSQIQIILAYHDIISAIDPDSFYPVIGYRVNEDALDAGVMGFEFKF
ncbi:MAG: hypothetical protein ACOH5I_17820 [Oligoflexus sp.]